MSEKNIYLIEMEVELYTKVNKIKSTFRNIHI